VDEDRPDLRGYDGRPCQGIAPWNRAENDDGLRHRWLNGESYRVNEWLPRPTHGRTLPLTTRTKTPGPVYVQIVPGPGGRLQIVRVDLAQPVARGFASPESARRWLGSAISSGILPEGVVELEPPTRKPTEEDRS
jgi:hypothetical protein